MAWYNSFDISLVLLVLFFVIGYILFFRRFSFIKRYFSTSNKSLLSKSILRAAYFVLFIVAFLGPLVGNSTKEVQAVGKDIYIAVDLSQSMNARDVAPSRLEKIKFELKKMVKEFNGDRIALIIFSSEAFMQCPLTYDQGALNLFLETLKTELVPNQGTNFAPPLTMALSKIQDESSPESDKKSKVIVLVSDGEDFGNRAMDIAGEIKNANIKLFTLGIGTQEGGEVIINGKPKRDNAGDIVISQLNAGKLKSLAQTTDGDYFEITHKKNEMDQLIGSIKNIEGQLRQTRTIDTSANQYYYFLVAGFMLFMVDLIWIVKPVII